jgi:hypothetical protein
MKKVLYLKVFIVVMCCILVTSITSAQTFQSVAKLSNYNWITTKNVDYLMRSWELKAGELVLVRNSGTKETYKFRGEGKSLRKPSPVASHVEYDVAELTFSAGSVQANPFVVQIIQYESPQQFGEFTGNIRIGINRNGMWMQYLANGPAPAPASTIVKTLISEWSCVYEVGDDGKPINSCTPSKLSATIQWNEKEISTKYISKGETQKFTYPNSTESKNGWELKLDQIKDNTVSKRYEYNVWNRTTDVTTDRIWIEVNNGPRILPNGYKYTHVVEIIVGYSQVEKFYANLKKPSATTPGMNNATSATSVVKDFLNALSTYGVVSWEAKSYIPPSFIKTNNIKDVVIDMLDAPWKYTVEKTVGNVSYVAVWTNKKKPAECYLLTMEGIQEDGKWYLKSETIGVSEITIELWTRKHPGYKQGYYTPGTGPY